MISGTKLEILKWSWKFQIISEIISEILNDLGNDLRNFKW